MLLVRLSGLHRCRDARDLSYFARPMFHTKYRLVDLRFSARPNESYSTEVGRGRLSNLNRFETTHFALCDIPINFVIGALARLFRLVNNTVLDPGFVPDDRCARAKFIPIPSRYAALIDLLIDQPDLFGRGRWLVEYVGR
jgi:hypothetical protein